MSSRRKAQKKGMNPAVAVTILLVSVAFAAQSVWGAFGAGGGGGLASLVGAGGMDEPAPADGSPAAIDWQDLLALHGSFDRATPVRMAFAPIAAAALVGAAPGGEIALRNDVPAWTGEDPPLLRLGVVMVSAASRRAVLGGAVVGVGDPAGQGVVVAIEPGVVSLRWHERLLTYDLDSVAPREFRAEYMRRQSAAQQGSQPDPTSDNPMEKR